MAGLRDALRVAIRGIRAFHGSPHDFDRFSLERIGTGEGAQAYGHGLYFAENEGVARAYRDQISKDWRRTGSGELFNPSSLEHLNVRVRATRGEIDSAIETARSVLAREDIPLSTKEMARRDLERLEAIQASGGLEPHQGRMYEVNLDAAPDEFLDWDSPLTHQPELTDRLRAIPQLARQPALFESKHATGMNAWLSGSADKQARVDALLSSGIKGIRYLDQGSRGAGEGSRNYAVFDDGIVNILRKYAVPGAVGLGGSGLTLREALADRMT